MIGNKGRNLVLVSGYYGFDNLGDEAILEELVTELKQFVDAQNVVVLSANPSKTAKLYGISAVDRWNFAELIGLMLKAKILISGGGGLFQDTTSTLSVLYYGFLIFTARCLGLKVLIYAQGIGPLRGMVGRSVTYMAMRLSNFICVRDKASLNLLNKWRIHAEKTADPVWCLNERNIASTIYEELQNFCRHSEPGQVCVGLSLRKTASFTERHFAAICQALIEVLPANAKLICLSLQDTQDKILLDKVVKMWLSQGRKAMLINASDVVYPSQWLSIMKSFDLLIGMRLHALVLSLKGAIPVVGLAYDPKVSQLMTEFEQPFLKLSNNVSDIKEDHLCVEYATMIKHALQNINVLSLLAKEKCELASQQAQRNSHFLARILDIPGNNFADIKPFSLPQKDM